MTLNLETPEEEIVKPCITVIGVGGAGGNAVNNMISSNLEGAQFVTANTDYQALENSLANRKIKLGAQLTKGLGAGASPEIGMKAAQEAEAEIRDILEGSNMLFITAGMGGGTGTGAAPVIARIAKEMGILTVGVVTKPFNFEGSHRMKTAEAGLREMQKEVDTLIIIPNQNLFRIADERTTFADAFRIADDVLHAGVRGVTDLMIMPGLINLDFADIKTVMSEMGKAMMGTGEAEGENRAMLAAESAISNPLLDNSSMKGARGVLINITGGNDMTLFEVDESANRIRDEVDPEANIIFGSTFNPDLSGKIRVSVVATGIGADSNKEHKQEARNQQTAGIAHNNSTASSLAATTHSYNDSARPMGDIFMAPKPAVPDQLDHANKPNTDTNDYEYLEEKVEVIEDGYSTVTEERSRGFGLFERMNFASQNSSTVKERTEDGEVMEKEDLSIPAFLRRKKK